MISPSIPSVIPTSIPSTVIGNAVMDDEIETLGEIQITGTTHALNASNVVPRRIHVTTSSNKNLSHLKYGDANRPAAVAGVDNDKLLVDVKTVTLALPSHVKPWSSPKSAKAIRIANMKKEQEDLEMRKSVPTVAASSAEASKQQQQQQQQQSTNGIERASFSQMYGSDGSGNNGVNDMPRIAQPMRKDEATAGSQQLIESVSYESLLLPHSNEYYGLNAAKVNTIDRGIGDVSRAKKTWNSIRSHDLKLRYRHPQARVTLKSVDEEDNDRNKEKLITLQKLLQNLSDAPVKIQLDGNTTNLLSRVKTPPRARGYDQRIGRETNKYLNETIDQVNALILNCPKVTTALDHTVKSTATNKQSKNLKVASSYVAEQLKLFENDLESFDSEVVLAELRYYEMISHENEIHGYLPSKVKAAVSSDLLLRLCKSLGSYSNIMTTLVHEVLNCLFIDFSTITSKTLSSADVFMLPTYFEQLDEARDLIDTYETEVSCVSKGIEMKGLMKKSRLTANAHVLFARDVCFLQWKAGFFRRKRMMTYYQRKQLRACFKKLIQFHMSVRFKEKKMVLNSLIHRGFESGGQIIADLMNEHREMAKHVDMLEEKVSVLEGDLKSHRREKRIPLVRANTQSQFTLGPSDSANVQQIQRSSSKLEAHMKDKDCQTPVWEIEYPATAVVATPAAVKTTDVSADKRRSTSSKGRR